MKRKLIFVLLIVSIMAPSCDEEMLYEFVIGNDCRDEIIVNFKTVDNIEKTISIDSAKTDTVYNFTIARGMHIYEREIDRTFTLINITYDNIPSKIDYLSNEVWNYKKKSETHAVYYLTVDSAHFK